MLYLARIPKPVGWPGGLKRRTTLRPPQPLVRLYSLERRPALPAAPPHQSEAPAAAAPHDAAPPQDMRDESRRDATPADNPGERREATDERGALREALVGRAELRGEADSRDKLREKALTASYDEYKELSAAWRNLDTKAQGNITVAGIFIAGAFAYLTKFTQPGIVEAGILSFAILFLVACVVLSVLVLQVREVPPHYLGGFMRDMVSDLEGKTDKEFREYLPAFYTLHARKWNESSEKLINANKGKGKRLWQSQVFLLAAIFTAALLVLFKLIKSA